MRKFQFEQNHMDTRVNITVFSQQNEQSLLAKVEKAFDVFRQLEKQFSIFKNDSEICLINARAGSPTIVTPLFFDTLSYSLNLAAETNGVFNPLVGTFTAPGAGEHSQGKFDFREIKLDQNNFSITLPTDGTLDLNSLVKGLALDLALECFDESDNVMIEAGGDLKVKGLPEGSVAWTIGIRSPSSPEKIITVINIKSGSICTTGNYFRKKSAEENHRYHLINPATRQTENNITSITVVAPSAKEADALSTAAFFFPIDAAIQLIEKHPTASCLIIDTKDQIFMSPRMVNTYFKTPAHNL